MLPMHMRRLQNLNRMLSIRNLVCPTVLVRVEFFKILFLTDVTMSCNHKNGAFLIYAHEVHGHAHSIMNIGQIIVR